VLTDFAGAILEFYAFDACGNAIGFDPSVALTEFLYSGEQFDSKIGQQYLRQRYYGSATGRFNRLDPFFGNVNDPQSLHKYLYTHADPVNGIDPNGLMTTASMSVAISSGIGMIGSTVTAISQVFIAVNTIITIFDIIKTVVDLTNDPITTQKIKTEATKYFTNLASSTVADYMVLKEKDFWIASAASFSSNLDEIGMAIATSNLVMNDIRNGIRRCSTPGMPRIIIQLPHPENAVIQ
jgi:RHS repeat-associated protein